MTDKTPQMAQTRRFRADVGGYFFALGLSSFFGVVFVILGFREHRLLMAGCEVSIAVAMWTFATLWITRFEIQIGNGEVVFSSLFGGRTAIPIVAIAKAELKWEVGNGMQGPLRLIVTPQRGSGFHRLSINAKVFSRDAIKAALDVAKIHGSADDGDLLEGVVMRAARRRR